MGGDVSYNVTLRNLLWLDASAPTLLATRVTSGAELTGGRSLCPLQIPGPITLSARLTSQSTYTLRTPRGCGPFFLVLGHVLLQISQRTIEKTIKQKGY